MYHNTIEKFWISSPLGDLQQLLLKFFKFLTGQKYANPYWRSLSYFPSFLIRCNFGLLSLPLLADYFFTGTNKKKYKMKSFFFLKGHQTENRTILLHKTNKTWLVDTDLTTVLIEKCKKPHSRHLEIIENEIQKVNHLLQNNSNFADNNCDLLRW